MQFEFFLAASGMWGPPMRNSNIGQGGRWREFELVEGGAHKRLREPKVIKRDGALILGHSNYLTNKLTL